MTWWDSIADQLWRAWAFLTTGRVLAVVFGIGFALLAVTLLIASRTKWGQAKPLTKCVVLSVLLHVWLLMYAIGDRQILPQGKLAGLEQDVTMQDISIEDISVSWEDSADALDVPDTEAMQEPPRDGESETRAWEEPIPLAELPKPAALAGLDVAADLAPALLPAWEPTPMPALPPLELLADPHKAEPTSESSHTHDSSAELASNVPMPEVEPPALEPLPANLASEASSVASTPSAAPDALRSVATNQSPVLPPARQLPSSSRLPAEYQLRQAPNRLQLSAAYGADADSEAAVEAGLQWLAGAQSEDGSWNAQRFGAGTETEALGENRLGTGAKADTGVTGLALLAFLSAGHTHRQGEYRQVVQRALEFLLDAQMPSGDLSGPKQVGSDWSVLNAKMYCHGIATLALAEAYGMTLDAGLRDALLKAAQYTINAQDVRGGGWRYRPHDPGDLSQFGWQAMALKSVQRSGIRIPIEVQRRMHRFLDSCAAGRAGGLATYQPRNGRPSDTMTAEALACRLLLDHPLSLEAQQEATSMILAHRPGESEDNVYFWYYATLALFQLQDENWRVWNQAMKQRLLATQVPAYSEQPGSWDPDALWGGYGGRVYSTAMSCLCLEVYYRYLPLYQRSSLARTPRERRFQR